MSFGLAEKLRVLNPRHPTAPARMSDGRFLTDYRPNCRLLQPLGTSTWADFDRRETMMRNGETARGMDRMLATMRGGRAAAVDTMVPELQKRTVVWDGASVDIAHRVGIGMGRNALPGRMDLVVADPDVAARATIRDCMLPGTWDPRMAQPAAAPAATVVGRSGNRYSAPYGN